MKANVGSVSSAPIREGWGADWEVHFGFEGVWYWSQIRWWGSGGCDDSFVKCE